MLTCLKPITKVIKLNLKRAELQSLVSIFDENPISPEKECQEIVLGIVQFDFILPGRKKLLTEANRFTFSLRRHQVKALTQYFKAIAPIGPYERVRVYNLLDQAMRQV